MTGPRFRGDPSGSVPYLRHQLRVADESGEDYLYPESCFVPVTLPERVAQQIAHTV